MILTKLFIDDFIRYLSEIESIQKNILEVPESTLKNEKKKMFSLILSASLCFETLKKYAPEAKDVLTKNVGVDFSKLYDFLVANNETYNLESTIVLELTSKISELKEFAKTIKIKYC